MRTVLNSSCSLKDSGFSTALVLIQYGVLKPNVSTIVLLDQGLVQLLGKKMTPLKGWLALYQGDFGLD
jgi:hypothetical protein